jgi:hypothetical protein
MNDKIPHIISRFNYVLTNFSKETFLKVLEELRVVAKYYIELTQQLSI